MLGRYDTSALGSCVRTIEGTSSVGALAMFSANCHYAVSKFSMVSTERDFYATQTATAKNSALLLCTDYALKLVQWSSPMAPKCGRRY